MNTSNSETRRGRPPKEMSERQERERRRRKTSEINEGLKMGVDPNLLDHSKYVYRFINDEQNGRVTMKTKYDDWDLVPNHGEKDGSTDLGAMVSYYVGSHKDGSPKRAYLARKPKEYHQDDQAEKQRKLDRELEFLRQGKDAQGADQSDYVPSSGIRVGR